MAKSKVNLVDEGFRVSLVETALFEYIELFYNRKRRHSALGYKTPQQVEDEALVT